MPTEPPLCVCHGEPSYWQKIPDRHGGGRWYCAVKQRARSRSRYQAVRETKLARQREEYHRPDGGWLRRRRRDLAKDRAQLQARLVELEQEASQLESQP